MPMYPTGRTTPLFVAGMRAMSDDYRRTFSLNAKDTEFVDVIRLDERNDISELELCYARSPQIIPRAIPRGEYVLTIKAFADVGGEVEGKYLVSVRDGILKFEPVVK
jgi:hypothetical protein